MLRRPCRVPGPRPLIMMRARASDTAARAKGAEIDQCKAWWNRVMELPVGSEWRWQLGKRKKWVEQRITSHPVTWPPNSAEKHTPLISAVCTKEVPQSQTSFCNIDLKALLNQLPKIHSLPWRSKKQRAGNQAKAVPEGLLGGNLTVWQLGMGAIPRLNWRPYIWWNCWPSVWLRDPDPDHRPVSCEHYWLMLNSKPKLLTAVLECCQPSRKKAMFTWT